MTHQRDDTVNWNEISMEEILELAIADEEYARDYYKHAAHLAGSLHTRRMPPTWQAAFTRGAC